MTTRHFGIPIGGTASLYRGGRSTDGPSLGDDTHADPNSSLAPIAPLERAEFSDSFRNKVTMVFLAFVICGLAAVVGVLFALVRAVIGN